MKTSCIEHVPNQKIAILKQDFIQICEGNLPAAIILAELEYWTNIKIEIGKQTQIENKAREKEGHEPIPNDFWIYKTHAGFIEDSLGLLKEHDVITGLNLLIELGFIERRRNPLYGYDRTWQYQVNVKGINLALEVCILHLSSMDAVQVTDQSFASEGAIPETPSEVPSESIAKSESTPILRNGKLPAPPPPSYPLKNPEQGGKNGKGLQAKPPPRPKPKQEIPPEVKDMAGRLLAAYEQASRSHPQGKDIGDWRKSCLEMAEQGITPDDLRAAVIKLRAGNLTVVRPGACYKTALSFKQERDREQHPEDVDIGEGMHFDNVPDDLPPPRQGEGRMPRPDTSNYVPINNYVPSNWVKP